MLLLLLMGLLMLDLLIATDVLLLAVDLLLIAPLLLLLPLLPSLPVLLSLSLIVSLPATLLFALLLLAQLAGVVLMVLLLPMMSPKPMPAASLRSLMTERLRFSSTARRRVRRLWAERCGESLPVLLLLSANRVSVSAWRKTGLGVNLRQGEITTRSLYCLVQRDLTCQTSTNPGGLKGLRSHVCRVESPAHTLPDLTVLKADPKGALLFGHKDIAEIKTQRHKDITFKDHHFC